jgi:hypothetical protein
MDAENGRRRCKARKHDGAPCRAAPMAREQFCFFHNPAKADARKVAQRRGGQGNRAAVPDLEISDLDLSSTDDVLKLLAERVNGLRRSPVNVKVDATLVHAAQVILRAQRELRLERRIAALERLRDDAPSDDELFNPNSCPEVK